MDAWIIGHYVIERDGRVFSLRTHKYLQPGMGTNGRPYVNLWDGKRGHVRYIHKLVAEAFLGPCPDGMIVSHLDDNPLNNVYTNLIYETQADNLARRNFRDDGFHNSRAVLKPGDPEKIKEFRAEGLTHQQIADKFGVSRVTISRVLNGKRYEVI